MERIAPVPEEIAAELEKGRIYPSPVYEVTPFVVHIGAGEYREKLVLSRPNVTFLGEGRDKTVLVFGDGANEIEEDGEKRGTFRTATLRIDTPDFTARHLTFQNDAGYGHTVGQALALYVDGDRCYFEDCAMLGSQDTLFDAPLPLDPVKPNGKGPGEHKPRIRGRHLYRNCFLQGDVDFIFGSGTAYFEECTIFSKKPGDRSPEDRDTSVYGYVTAASTHPEFPYGYVLHKCKLTSDCPKGSVYLDVPGKNGQKRYFWSANWENIFILRAGWTGERPTDISITESTIPMAPGQVLKRERIFPISLPEKRRSSIPWKSAGRLDWGMSLQENGNYEGWKQQFSIKLNEQQERAVRTAEGSVLLLAVPGSGKTTVLVARLGYLIFCWGILPENILTITYTVAAPRDMKRRFGETFGEAMNGVTLTTTIPVTGTAGERISTTIKAIAVKSGMQNSSVTSATYVIELPAPAPSTYAVTVNNGTCDGALDKLTGIYVDDNIAPQALSPSHIQTIQITSSTFGIIIIRVLVHNSMKDSICVFLDGIIIFLAWKQELCLVIQQ